MVSPMIVAMQQFFDNNQSFLIKKPAVYCSGLLFLFYFNTFLCMELAPFRDKACQVVSVLLDHAPELLDHPTLCSLALTKDCHQLLCSGAPLRRRMMMLDDDCKSFHKDSTTWHEYGSACGNYHISPWIKETSYLYLKRFFWKSNGIDFVQSRDWWAPEKLISGFERTRFDEKGNLYFYGLSKWDSQEQEVITEYSLSRYGTSKSRQCLLVVPADKENMFYRYQLSLLRSLPILLTAFLKSCTPKEDGAFKLYSLEDAIIPEDYQKCDEDDLYGCTFDELGEPLKSAITARHEQIWRPYLAHTHKLLNVFKLLLQKQDRYLNHKMICSLGINKACDYLLKQTAPEIRKYLEEKIPKEFFEAPADLPITWHKNGSGVGKMTIVLSEITKYNKERYPVCRLQFAYFGASKMPECFTMHSFDKVVPGLEQLRFNEEGNLYVHILHPHYYWCGKEQQVAEFTTIQGYDGIIFKVWNTALKVSDEEGIYPYALSHLVSFHVLLKAILAAQHKRLGFKGDDKLYDLKNVMIPDDYKTCVSHDEYKSFDDLPEILRNAITARYAEQKRDKGKRG